MSEQFGGDLVVITDENGEEYELEIIDEFSLDGKTYTVFVPADIDSMDVNDPRYGFLFLLTSEENGEVVFDVIEDEAEQDRVYEAYEQILDAEEAEEESEEQD